MPSRSPCLQVRLTAGTQFCHGTILRPSRKPFPNIRTYNAALVEAWNARVASSGDIWHLGDFALGF
ncbi:hypothetical protein [Methylobacterium sp. D48H]